MNWQFTPYAVPLFVGSVILAVIGIVAWRKRHLPGAVYVLMLAFNQIFYVLGYAFELGATDTDSVDFWLKIEHLGISFGPVFMLMVVLAYTGSQRYLTRLNTLILIAFPTTTIVLALTNNLHGLIWSNITIDRSAGFTATIFDRGLWSWLQYIHTYVLVILSILLLVQAFISAREGFYRKHYATLLGVIILPTVLDVLYVLQITPAGLDVAVYGLMLSASLVATTTLQYGLFDLVPNAQEAVVTSMSDAVIVLDLEDRTVDLNPAAQRLFKARGAAQSGRIPGDSGGQWHDILTTYRGVWHAHTEIMLNIDGQNRYFDLQLTPLTSSAGHKQGRVIVLHDISHRIATENALRQANERLTVLRQIEADLAQKLDVIYISNVAMNAAIQLSQADAVVIGLVEDRGIYAAHAKGAYTEDDLKKYPLMSSGISARVIRQREPELVLDVQQDPDYLNLIAETKAQISVPLLSGDKLIGVLTLETHDPDRFNTDVLESIKLLAARVAIAWDNASMYEDRERLIRELDAFAQTVAHDLKNPMNIMYGYADILLTAFEEYSPEEIKHFLAQIHKGAEKANSIIHALLLLAGVSASEHVQFDEIDMTAVVSEASMRLINVIEDSGSELITPDAWPTAMGYAPWVEEVWINLVSNAFKYGGEPPRVELGYDDERDEGFIRFWVQDNGKGLPAEKQAEVFQPFNRLGLTDSRGHGLGLSIVQRITERLGGSVGVESQPGHGSRFYFTLPQKQQP
jgi:PAS domain S-box-containing protein